MKKIILFAAFAFLTACSSEEWSPVLVDDEIESSSAEVVIESSSAIVELSSSSIVPVVSSSSVIVPVVESSSSVIESSSSEYDECDDLTEEECRIHNMTDDEFCHYICEEYGCDVAIVHGCEKYLHDECWE